MIDLSVEVEGLDDLTEKLEGLVNLAKQTSVTQAVCRFALKELHADVVADAPRAEEAYYRYSRGSARARRRGNPQNSRRLVQPGTLQESIKFKRIKLPKSVGVGIYVTNKAFYWRFIENGTPHMAAEPFLRNNFDHQKERVVERFKTSYARRIKAIIKKQQVNADAGD